MSRLLLPPFPLCVFLRPVLPEPIPFPNLLTVANGAIGAHRWIRASLRAIVPHALQAPAPFTKRITVACIFPVEAFPGFAFRKAIHGRILIIRVHQRCRQFGSALNPSMSSARVGPFGVWSGGLPARARTRSMCAFRSGSSFPVGVNRHSNDSPNSARRNTIAVLSFPPLNATNCLTPIAASARDTCRSSHLPSSVPRWRAYSESSSRPPPRASWHTRASSCRPGR